MIRFIDYYLSKKINIFLFIVSFLSLIIAPLLMKKDTPILSIIYPFLLVSIIFHLTMMFFWIRMLYMSYWLNKCVSIQPHMSFLNSGKFSLVEFSRFYHVPVRASFHILSFFVFFRYIRQEYHSIDIVYHDPRDIPDGVFCSVRYSRKSITE